MHHFIEINANNKFTGFSNIDGVIFSGASLSGENIVFSYNSLKSQLILSIREPNPTKSSLKFANVDFSASLGVQ